MPRRAPTLEDLLRADAERSRQLTQGNLPRRGNNPWQGYETPTRSTYADPTANTAIKNVARDARSKARTNLGEAGAIGMVVVSDRTINTVPRAK